MFENKTKDYIHQEMLQVISPDYDKTVGSFVFDSTEPPADQLAEGYKDLDVVVNKLSIDNLTEDELEQRIYERTGITRKKATFATTLVTVTGQPGAFVNNGDKVSSDTVNYTFQESKTIDSSGQVYILVRCDVAGIIGNAPTNSIKSFPITLQGLTAVTNIDPVTNGYDAEPDEELLKRYYERIQTPPTSGNKAHYKNWAKEVTGVGDAKVFPLWNGDNTVKVIIIDSNKSPANSNLIDDVQTYIDPGITGLGDGQAPIGAFCTVESATGLTINLSFTASKDPAYTDQQRLNSVNDNITNFFKEIAFVDNIISYAKIGAIILESDGILDYESLRVNGGTANLALSDIEVPVLGVITIA